MIPTIEQLEPHDAPAASAPIHTAQSLTPKQMATGLALVGRPVERESVPLKHPVDYSKVI